MRNSEQHKKRTNTVQLKLSKLSETFEKMRWVAGAQYPSCARLCEGMSANGFEVSTVGSAACASLRRREAYGEDGGASGREKQSTSNCRHKKAHKQTEMDSVPMGFVASGLLQFLCFFAVKFTNKCVEREELFRGRTEKLCGSRDRN